MLLVMAAHAELPGFRHGGAVGVTVFFVLSGFLISALLVEEADRDGGVDLVAFYRRRARRLLPAIGALVVVLVGLGLATVGDGAWALSYVANWQRAGGGSLGYLSHTWSLAVEEQYYLVFPVAFMVGRRHLRIFVGALAALAVASAIARAAMWTGAEATARVYFGSDTRADAILLGCVVGIVFVRRGPIVPHRYLAAGAAVALGLVTASTSDVFTFRAGFTIAAVASALVIARVVVIAPRALESRPLVIAGQASYALYLWHVPAMWFLRDRMAEGPARVVVGFAASAALAWASTVFVEAPFRRRRAPLPLPGRRGAGRRLGIVEAELLEPGRGADRGRLVRDEPDEERADEDAGGDHAFRRGDPSGLGHGDGGRPRDEAGQGLSDGLPDGLHGVSPHVGKCSSHASRKPSGSERARAEASA